MLPCEELRRRQTQADFKLHDTKVHAKSRPCHENAYTWQEVAEHNTSNSAWVIIRGFVYDVTDWADRHPGGSELIWLHAGRECTSTFESYHSFSDKAEIVLQKYYIGKLSGNTEFPTYKPDTGFYKECAQAVRKYFKDNRLDPKAAFPGLWRMVLVLCVAVTSYFGMHKQLMWSNGYLQVFWAILFGVCQALPLLHIMHDCSHAAYTNNPFWWKYIGRGVLDWLAGASIVSWQNQHIVGHHIYTNVACADPDLPCDMDRDLRRVVDRQTMQSIYKYQHIYLPPLYGLLGLKFRIQDLLETFWSRSNGPVRVNPIDVNQWLELMLSRLFWAFYRIYIPLFVYKISPLKFWSTFVLAELVTGWYLSFNFQVSHISTECDYANGKGSNESIEDEWAVSQVKSSLDYGHNSVITAFLTGCLNYQVTHHLFPSISQYHYPAIAPIIMKVCKKYKVPYRVLPSFSAALMAHLSHLKSMGVRGQPVKLHIG